MEKQQIIDRSNQILGEVGMKVNLDYMWSLQGPTIIPIGSTETFQNLIRDRVEDIKKTGAQFLVEPVG
jgi:hypothetical protein